MIFRGSKWLVGCLFLRIFLFSVLNLWFLSEAKRKQVKMGIENLYINNYDILNPIFVTHTNQSKVWMVILGLI